MMRSKVITLVSLIILIVACQSQQNEMPYKKGNAYMFRVSVKDSNSKILTTDTLTLTIKNKGIIGEVFGMNMAEWTSTKYPDNKEERGVNLEKGRVEIQTPLNYDYLENENIVIAGYPSFSKSMLIGYESNSNHHFPKSYGSLAGKKLKQYKKIVDSSAINYRDKPIGCKVAEYKNLNLIDKFGHYRLKTYYNKNFGFIKLNYYYPNGKKITFKLIGIKSQ